MGDIGVAQSDHNVIYVGTGEAAIRGDITFGDGVYKSVDGGRNWKNIGLKDSRHIGALIVHPTNPDIVFVAALGHAFGPNSERGIFKTTDGGRTWRNVLSKDENTGGIDIVFDPHNPNILFAALWQARREPWYFSSGGPGSGLYRSIDGGETWQHLEGNGLRMESSDESESLFRAPIQIGYTRCSRPRKVAFSDRTTAAITGCESTMTGVFGNGPGISARSMRIRNRLIRSMS